MMMTMIIIVYYARRQLSGSKVSHKTHIVYMNFIYKHFNKRKQNVHSSS